MNKVLKYILMLLGIFVLAAVLVFFLKPELFSTVKNVLDPNFRLDNDAEFPLSNNNLIDRDSVEPVVALYQDIVPEGAEPVTFRGVFQEYGTGCFADGECYAIVDDKHITTILGWTQEVVGSFENPDIPIGTQVEVYALPTESGKYTLYGSQDFYIKEI